MSIDKPYDILTLNLTFLVYFAREQFLNLFLNQHMYFENFVIKLKLLFPYLWGTYVFATENVA